jgi:Resolvase, N terminal domain
MKYGYARVSTDGQSIDAQVRQLKAAGARQVFREVASGAKTDRAQLRRVLAQLDAGDVLMVTRLDRLARSTRDLLNTIAANRRPGRWLPIASRYMGRHHHAARPLDAHRARGARRRVPDGPGFRAPRRRRRGPTWRLPGVPFRIAKRRERA